MKKVFAIVLCALLLTGCAASVPQEIYDELKAENDALKEEIEELEEELSARQSERDAAVAEAEQLAGELAAMPTPPPPPEPIPDGVADSELAAQLSWEWFEYESYGTQWAIINVTNNTPYLLELGVYATFLEDGEMVAVDDASEHAFSPGATYSFPMRVDTEFDEVICELTAVEEDYYGDAVSHLAYEVKQLEDRAIISVVNNGDKPADFVYFVALFFDEGELVDHTGGYVVDNDSEIKPGKTLSEEAHSSHSYDEVRFYLNGRTSN